MSASCWTLALRGHQLVDSCGVFSWSGGGPELLDVTCPLWLAHRRARLHAHPAPLTHSSPPFATQPAASTACTSCLHPLSLLPPSQPPRSINCMHILPDLAFVEKKYAGTPFAVVSGAANVHRNSSGFVVGRSGHEVRGHAVCSGELLTRHPPNRRLRPRPACCVSACHKRACPPVPDSSCHSNLMLILLILPLPRWACTAPSSKLKRTRRPFAVQVGAWHVFNRVCLGGLFRACKPASLMLACISSAKCRMVCKCAQSL